MRDGEKFDRRICWMCENKPPLTVGTYVPKIRFRLSNGLECQASKSNGNLWASLSTTEPHEGGIHQGHAFDQFVWLFRFKGKNFVLFLQGRCNCPLCFIRKLKQTGSIEFDPNSVRIWVFKGYSYAQDRKEDGLFETAVKNNCPPAMAPLFK
jgi:hypothetical protein